jgi:hypothetical protein
MENILLKAQVKINGRKLSSWETAIFALILYVCLLIFHGYVYGYGDQIEIVPVLHQLNHPKLYDSDFFIQHIIQKPVHERWFFVHTIQFFRLFTPMAFFILHAIFSIILILGIDKIAQFYIHQPYFRWIAIICILLISYNINLGGNELYYNLLIPSLVAKALSVWGIYYAMTERWVKMVPSLIVATFVQPLVGIQVLLLCFLSTFPIKKEGFTQALKKTSIPYFIVLVFILPWLFLLYTQHAQGDISDALLFEIMEFRLSHHFFPGWFSKKGYLLIPILTIIGFFKFLKIEPFLSRYIAWASIGCLVYTIGVEWLEIPLFLNTQWFKTTIWIKAFGFIAAFAILEQILSIDRLRTSSIYKWLQARHLNWNLPLLIPILLILIKISPLPFIKNRPYDFPWQDSMTQEKDISIRAGELSNMEAIFVVPPNFTMFKWYSKRSSYVDYKAMIHHKDVMAEWYQRIQFIYQFNLDTKKQNPDENKAAAQYHRTLTSKKLQEWKTRGIDYIITQKNTQLPLSQLTSNESYTIYALTSEAED